MPIAPDGSYEYGSITNSCTATGGVINVNNINVYDPYSLIVEVYSNDGASFSQTLTPGTYGYIANFANLPNGLYNLKLTPVKDALNQTPEEVFSIANIACGETDNNNPPVNDLTLTLTLNHVTTNGGSNGSVVFNVGTSNTPYQTRINALPLTTNKNVYDNLPADIYNAYVIDAAGFVVTYDFTITEPAPAPKGPNQYYAVGGTLPNPINITINLDSNYNNVPKLKHFIDIEVYSNNILVDTRKQRVRNGNVIVDVSESLRKSLKLDNLADLMLSDADLVSPFYIRYREQYNDIIGEWISTINQDTKYAVQAALQQYDSNMFSYVGKANNAAKWLTGFNYPVKFACYGMWISSIIDNSMLGTPLYWERSYYASDGTLVDRRSDLIPESYYGKLSRYQIKDDVLPCANYIDAVITTEYRTMAGICEGVTPPIGYKIFTYQFDNSFN